MMRVARGLRAAVAVVAAAGCGHEQVSLATIIDGGGGGGRCEEGDVAMRCFSDSDCEQLPGTFCSKSSCQSSEQGFCKCAPPTCTSDYSPVCGCDDVTYFNPCLRVQAHQNPLPDPATGLPAQRQCFSGCPDGGCSKGTCGFINDFAPGAPMSGACPPPSVTGFSFIEMLKSCWVLPDTCPDASSPLIDCRGTGQCIDRCNAARRGGVYFAAQQCLQQP